MALKLLQKNRWNGDKQHNDGWNTNGDMAYSSKPNTTKFEIQGFIPVLNKNFKDFSRTFKDSFPSFQGLHSVQKRQLSLCLF